VSSIVEVTSLVALCACAETTRQDAGAQQPANGAATSQAGRAATGMSTPSADASTAGRDASTVGAGGASAAMDAGARDSSTPDACTRPDMPGVKICCGSPGEIPGGNCLPSTAADMSCSKEGEVQDLKLNKRCCSGLTPVQVIDVDDAGECTQQEIIDPTRLCTHCGDGQCGAGENACNCARDCQH
jgi:hypothetical protein